MALRWASMALYESGRTFDSAPVIGIEVQFTD